MTTQVSMIGLRKCVRTTWLKGVYISLLFFFFNNLMRKKHISHLSKVNLIYENPQKVLIQSPKAVVGLFHFHLYIYSFLFSFEL